ncbi:hypothetical protein QWM81_05595 [Streptomyces ficellus]|uniref:GNAT family N-acetyltransferase n=1 Tax=Streptomyces ficellus TaxID=1977088 RepID=A0ABT7Z1Z8_9ACTN|nr:hypothetical protein [Streptomyces ficellus]MDN3293522.1 hypothetical protein [Streptomyces ficellus]
MTIRPATADDVPRVKALTDAAYHHHIERTGLVPAPMEADHAADVAAGKLYERYGYEVVKRHADGPYDRVHYRKPVS